MSMVAALSVALALAAPPQTNDLKLADLADLQCLAMLIAYAPSDENDSLDQAGFASGVTYYFGRLQGRTPGVDWLPRMRKFRTTLTAEDLQGFAPRCAAELGEMGRAMIAFDEEPPAPASTQ